MKTNDPLPAHGERWPPLDAARLNGALTSAPGLWREIRVVEETGSTNADLLAEARSGARDGVVLVAEAQTAGRGRLGRRWVSPPRGTLTFSVLLRPAGVPAGLLGWLPLLAAPDAASRPAGADGADVRERLLATVLDELARWYRAWRDQPRPGDADACGLRAEYLRRSDTVGAEVTVMLPGGQNLTGTATGVDPAGRLEVRTPAGLVQVSAGDVVHLRPADTPAAR